MTDETTPQDSAAMPPASAGSHGSNGLVAYYVHGSEYDTGCEFEYVTLSLEHAEASGGTVATLVQITDEEREAVAYCVSCAQDYRETLDCCEQSEKYDRATRMIDAAMRLVILTVGPSPVERLGATKVTDVGGAGPT